MAAHRKGETDGRKEAAGPPQAAPGQPAGTPRAEADRSQQGITPAGPSGRSRESGADFRSGDATQASLTPSEVARLEQEVEAFEREWERGEPRLADFLPPAAAGDSGSVGTALAYELALIDLEHRLKRGQPARAEQYLGVHPALDGSGSFLREAVALEFALRKRADPALDPGEYAARFPALGSELADLLPGATSLAATRGRGPEAEPAGGERYVELEQIGRGGMGVVHRVHDMTLQRDIARKTLRLAAAAPDGRGEFLAEARISGQLDHPNIAPVHDLGVDAEGRPFFTMKLVAGETLGARIRRLRGEGPPGAAIEPLLRVFLKVCDAVEFAHAKGIVHRDLKPQNVMVGSHGQVYVMDWGLSVRAAGPEPGSGGVVVAAGSTPTAGAGSLSIAGTLGYMAPEQAGGAGPSIGPWTDVFALGAILYEIATGRAPHPPGTPLDRVRRAEFDPPEKAAGCPVPPGLCALVSRAMQAAPAARYPGVAHLKEAVEEFLRGGGWFATRRFAAGETIVREGDPADAAYVITEGSCVVEQARAAGTVRLRTLGVGDVFGETALLGPGRRTATVRAEGPVEVRVVTAEALARELDRSELVKAVVLQLNRRFLDLERAGQAGG